MKLLHRDRLLTGVSLALLLLQMSLKGHLRGGVLLGLALVLTATLGALGLMGDSPLDLRGDEGDGAEDIRPWWRREGLWVISFGGLLYLPFAGAYGLWDPWETHYSEVAREILSRDDWITTWWAQEGWFISKPILVFWMSAMGMGIGTLFGLKVSADCGPGAHEWFIRVPICLLTIAALYAVYRAVSSAWSRRAGFLCAVVLATMPQWFFLAHQAMTDMPFVAPLTLSLSMFALAVSSAPEELVQARKIGFFGRGLRFSLWHITVGFVLVCSIPQIAYLLTRTLVVACPGDSNAVQCARVMASNKLFGLVQLPFEMFYLGSAGNSGVNGLASVPGSPAWERVASNVPFMPSVVQGVVWTALLLALLSGLRHLRNRQHLYILLFYVWAAISTLGKGPGGIAIPAAVAGLHILSSGRWHELRRLRLAHGLLAFLIVGMPWYLAITGRLGREFIERFIYHDIINRTVLGVHGDTGTLRYFIWQLGYAMFPWSGLVPAALGGWRLLVPRDATEAQKDIARLALLWFLVSFVLFSAMITKFHHYIFPAVPAAAILVGLLLDRMLGSPVARARPSSFGWELVSLLLLATSITLTVVGGASLVGSWRGLVPAQGALSPQPTLGAVLLITAATLWALGWALHRRANPLPPSGAETLHYRESPETQGEEKLPEVSQDTPELSVAFGACSVGAAVLCLMVARDLVVVRSNPPGFERLIHLFVYNYDRAWPTRVLDYRGALFGFGLAAVLCSLALGSRALRPWAVRGVLVLGSLFALWGLDVYMLGVTPHWSQRGIFERYYAMRHPRSGGQFAFDPVIAYQMNWKGENFYTGNHLVVMECGLKYCTERTPEWVAAHPRERVFFVTEHSRVPSLLATLRTHGGDGHTVTTERDDNKFVLVEALTGAGRGTTARPTWQPDRSPR